MFVEFCPLREPKTENKANQDGEKNRQNMSEGTQAGITSQASRPGAASEETPRSPEANPSDSAMAVVPRAD